MKLETFEGVIAAMATPMHQDETVNFEETARLIKHLSKEGLHGITVCGTTGEYSLMNKDERKEIFRVAVEAAKDTDSYIVAGVSCQRLRDTIELAGYAGQIGVDFVMVLPPYYLPTSQQGIINYYREVADNTKAGVVIYHYPDNTSVELSPELIIKIAEHPNIVGIKNTHNMKHTLDLIELNGHNQNFKICNGYEHLFLPTLACGGDAIMGIVPNLAPKALRQMYDCVKENDLSTAMKINEKLVQLNNAQDSADNPCPGPVKYGLQLLGFNVGDPREPITSVTEEFKTKYKVIMEQAGLL